MAEVVTIEVRGIFKDMITPNISSSKQSVDKFTQSIKKSQTQIDRLSGKKANPKVELLDKASSNISKIDGALSKLGKASIKTPVTILDYATKPLRMIKDSLFSIKTLVAAIGTGMVANQLLMNPISVADAYSSAKIGFSTLLGEQGGQDMMDKLDQFAKETPFKTSGVIDNAQKMMAMGWDAENIIEDMRIIGDAAAATGKMDQGLESIVRALSQIKTKGKLSTEELNQLAEAGISAKAMLAEQLGYGTGDAGIAAMTEKLEDGLIGSEVALEALLNGMKQYEGTMDRTANETVEGLKSQLEDTFEINIVRKWGQGLQDGAKRGLGSILALLDKSEESLAKFGDTVYKIGKELSNWAADKLEGTIDKILQIVNRQDFKNASLGGKIKILWDEVIAEPFEQWWHTKGEPFISGKMNSIGEGIGRGLSNTLLGLLGVDIYGVADDALGIGGSFAKGFAKGFESEKVWDGIVDAIGKAISKGFEKLCTGNALERIIAGGIAVKVLNGVLSGVSMAQTLWGGTGAVTEAGSLTLAGMGLKGVIGSTGNAMVNGSGILGGLATLGYKASGFTPTAAMYFGNMAGAMTGGKAALMGLGTVGAGLFAGYGIYDTIGDFYEGITTKGNKESNNALRNAYVASGTLKATGMATGAMAGAAIGSAVPVIGTLLGALIGAGAGWLGGKFLGDNEIKNAEKLEKSIEAAKYSSQEMKDAIMDGTKSADELEAIFKEACSQDMVKRFGDIELSMEEIARYSKDIVFGKQAENMEKFANASAQASQSISTFQSALNDMDRLNFDMSERLWKVGAGIGDKLSEEEIATVKARVQSYLVSAEKALSDSHYEFNAAVDILVEGEIKNDIIEGGNGLYTKLQKELDTANKKLEASYEVSLKDGIITAEEQKIISDYQAKVAEIIDKISNAETEASFEISKLKFTTGDLSAESFANLQSALNTQMNDYVLQQDEALKVSMTGLKLELKEGAITQSQYDEQVTALFAGYNANIREMSAQVQKVQLEGIAEAFDGAGTVDQLQSAINALTKEGKDPLELTFSDINAHLKMNEKSLSKEEKANFTAVMQQALESSMTGENALKPQADVITSLIVDEPILHTQAGSARSLAQTSLDSAFNDALNTKGVVNVGLDWNITSGSSATVSVNGSSTTLTASLTKNANGGYIDKAINTIVGEAGPEMIIPLSANRRQRGKYLWERAGRAMGLFGSSSDENVMMNANGGLYGLGASKIGQMLNGTSSNRSTENTQQASGNRAVNVEVGGITLTIQSSGNGVEADLEANEDAIVGRIAKMLEQAFENMPLAIAD